MDDLSGMFRRFFADEPYRRLTPDEVWAKFRDDRDEAAFRVFLERVGGRIYLVCRSVLANDAEADEAFQEAFAQLLRHSHKLASHKAAVAWLYVTARNAARRVRRRGWRWAARDRKAAVPEAVEPAIDAGLQRDESQRAVLAAVAGLPASQRRAVELVYLEGMTHAEAAEALGWTRGSVGKYVQRGLARLRGSLGRDGLMAVGGAAGVEGVLSGVATAAGRPPAVSLTAAAPSAVGWPVWAAAGVVAVGATAGIAVWPTVPDPAPPPTVVVESVPDRNLRVFHADVLPVALAALRAAAGEGGDATLEAVGGFDTRVDATFAVHYRPADGKPFAAKVRCVADADRRDTFVLLDPLGNGKFYRFFQPAAKPTIFHRVPWGGMLTVAVKPLTDVVAAFDRLPRDARTAAVAADFRAATRAAVAGYLGDWYERGDPARPWALGWHGDELRFVPPAGRGWAQLDGTPWIVVSPDGPTPGRLLFVDFQARFGPAGRRFELAGGRDDIWAGWWTRDPDRR